MTLIALAVALGSGSAGAQQLNVKVGVLTDMSSLYADATGPGSLVAARIAAADFMKSHPNFKVDVVSGDHQNTRSWTKRWQGELKNTSKFPTMNHAGVYAGTLHYLKAVAARKGAADGKAVVAEMKKLPTDDPLFGKGVIRADGRKVHPAYLFEVKAPGESKYPGDFYKVRATIPADEAFRPMKDGNCPLVHS